MADTPMERFVLLVLSQAQQDGATELKIPPNENASAAISYKVDGKWHDFAPPPAQLLPEAITELLRLAGIQDSPFPKTGLIDTRYGAFRLNWKISMPTAEGGCVLTPALA
jgi:type II secretory ATPase GspE/PulE/Tfp pilus assembly ATPase PilB-like protein